MGKKLSFIIPVYNVEEYLEECVDSILCQADENCEIILVDDGSTDSSGMICDKYAESNENVFAIHKENGGSSSARNFGISCAKGEYLLFVDSDDIIIPNSIKEILEWTNKFSADICFLKGEKFYPSGKVVSFRDEIFQKDIREKKKIEVFVYLASRPKFAGSACTKLFSTTFLEKNSLKFPVSRRHGEDLTFCRDCFLKAEKFDSLDMNYYRYRQERRGSVTDAISKRSFFEVGKFISESAEKLTDNKKAKGKIEECAMSFVAYEYTILLWQYSLLEKEDKKEACEFLKKWKWVLKYSGNIKTKGIAIFTKMFGMKFVSKILNIYLRIRRF